MCDPFCPLQGLRTRTNSTVASQRSGVEGRASQLGGELDNSDTDSHTTVYEEGDLADLASPMFSDDTGLQKTGRLVRSHCIGVLSLQPPRFRWRTRC